MKKNLVFCFLLLGTSSLYAQDNNDDTTVYRIVEQKPEFIGDVNRYLADSIVYPPSARDSAIDGTIYMGFIIEKNGSISNIQSIRSGIGRGTLVQECMRVIKNMPKWIPGMQNGKPVRVQYMLPIHFVE